MEDVFVIANSTLSQLVTPTLEHLRLIKQFRCHRISKMGNIIILNIKQLFKLYF